MPLESGNYIYDLIPSNPPDTDLVQQGDDHLRLIKTVIQQTWPNITGWGLPTSTGSANAQNITHVYAPVGYTAGMEVLFKAGFTNTGFLTVNINGAGTAGVYSANGPLVGGEVQAGSIYMLVYDSTTGAFNIMGTSSGYLPLAGGNLTGQVAGPTFIASTSMQVYTPTGTPAWLYTTVANVRQYITGCNTDGTYLIYDVTGAASRLLIDASGNATFYKALTVGGNLQVTGTINSNANIGVNVSGAAANFFSTVTGVRQWYWGTQGDGTFGIVDATGGAERFQIDLSGYCHTLSRLLVGDSGIAYTTYSAVPLAMKWTGNATNMRLMANGADQGSFYITTSDERMKEDFGDPEGDALAEIRALVIRSFKFKEEHGGARFRQGLTAQQVQTVIPEAVPPASDPDEKLGINPLPLLARCVGAIQQLTARVEALEAQLAGGR